MNAGKREGVCVLEGASRCDLAEHGWCQLSAKTGRDKQLGSLWPGSYGV